MLSHELKRAGPDARCETGKRIYFKERAANKAITEAIKRGELPQLRHYQCGTCGYWHLSRVRPPRPSPDAGRVAQAPTNCCARFCSTCGAESWHLRGSDVDTCRRGHHHPCCGGVH